MTGTPVDEPFFRIEPAEAKGLIEKGVPVVDVREPQEYAQVRIPNSTLVPLGTLLRSPREFMKEGAVLFICSEGIRSAVACEAAAAIGLDEVYNLEGGIQRWETEGYPVELGQGSEPVIAEAPAEPQVPHLDFLQPGEHLVQIHRFRYVRAVTCALGTIELVVEETFYGESVKGAL